MANDLASARVFDHMAANYDDTFSNTRLGRMLRLAVWRRISPWIAPARRIADIGCGTGIDAVWLGNMGKRVVAIDPSPRMVAVARSRIARENLAHSVDVQTADLDKFCKSNSERFDFILSNFGALNCVEDLGEQLKALSVHQPIGGLAALVLLNRRCLWEQAWFLLRGCRRKAFRRLNPADFEVGGRQMRVHYPDVGRLIRDVAPEYRLEVCAGIGVLLPPSYLAGMVERFPRIFGYLETVEDRIATRASYAILGDHVLILLRRGQ